MHNYITLLSDLSYELGLIGIAEYTERQQISDWLSDEANDAPDPRGPSDEAHERRDEEHSDQQNSSNRQPSRSNSSEEDEDENGRWPQFLALNRWMFTLGDRDCYPSVPHGHFRSKTNEWPKLNPYTGRAFSGVHLEDLTSRLSRAEMKNLWRDDGFVEFCRKQVLWYSDFAPEYAFPRARRGKFHFPRW